MTKNRTPTPVYVDPGMHPGPEVKGLINMFDNMSYLSLDILLAEYFYQTIDCLLV